MRMFSYIDRYLNDNEFKVSIDNLGINIINYTLIEDFSSTRVIIKYKSGFITLNGTDLVISKMQDDELFIIGNLKSIEYN